MTRHFIIDTHGELGNLDPFEIFFFELAARGDFNLLRGEWDILTNDPSLDNITQLIRRNILMSSSAPYSLIFLVDLPEGRLAEHPLVGCLVDQLYRIKENILNPLMAEHISPQQTWVIAFDRLSRDAGTGTLSDSEARLRWEYDAKGYVSNAGSVPGVLDEGLIDSFISNDAVSLARELEDRICDKIKELSGCSGKKPSFLREEKLIKFLKHAKDVISNPCSDVKQDYKTILINLIKGNFSVSSSDLECFNIIRFRPAEEAFNRLDRSLVELAQLVLYIMSGEGDSRFSVTGPHVWNLDKISFNTNRFSAVVACYQATLNKLGQKLETKLRSSPAALFEIASDSSCSCQGGVEHVEVDKIDFSKLLDRKDPIEWKKKVDDWEDELDKLHEKANEQVENCYGRIRSFNQERVKREEPLGEFIKSGQKQLLRNRKELIRQISQVSCLDPGEWRKNKEYYKTRVIELLNARPTWFGVFLCISVSLVIMGSTWLYPINHSGPKLYYAGFLIFALLPILAFLTSLQVLTKEIEKGMEDVIGEIRSFSRKILERFNNLMKLVESLCKNSILRDNLQRATTENRELKLEYNLAMHHKKTVKHIARLVANIKSNFELNDSHEDLEDTFDFAFIDKIDLKKPLKRNPLYAIINSHIISMVQQLHGAPYESGLLYILDTIEFWRDGADDVHYL